MTVWTRVGQIGTVGAAVGDLFQRWRWAPFLLSQGRMMTILRTVLALLIVVSIVEAGPPPLVIERFISADDALESGHFQGSYTLMVSSVVAKGDGSSKKTTDMELIVEIGGEGEENRRLVRLLVDGEDRTERNRDKLESGAEDGDDHDEGDDDFLIPFGNDAVRFAFGPAVTAGGHIEMTFEPAKGHEDDDGITRGSMAWDEKTQDPLWLELDVFEPPKPLRELKVRMEFERVGEGVYMSRMVTDGRVKILLMKRIFHMEMTVSDVESAG